MRHIGIYRVRNKCGNVMSSSKEKREGAVQLGKVDPLKLADFPILPGILAMMGPGIVWASMAQGSGELI